MVPGMKWITAWLKGRGERTNPLAAKHEDQLGSAIRDAQVLLKFAIESQKAINPKIVDELIDAIGNLQAFLASDKRTVAGTPADPPPSPSITFEQAEKAFWNAYEALGQIVTPVTAQSIAASTRQLNLPVNVTFPYAMFALFIFFVIVWLQWRWFDETTLRKNLIAIEQAISEREPAVRKKSFEIAQIRTKFERETAELQTTCPDPDNDQPLSKVKRKPLTAAQVEGSRR